MANRNQRQAFVNISNQEELNQRPATKSNVSSHSTSSVRSNSSTAPTVQPQIFSSNPALQVRPQYFSSNPAPPILPQQSSPNPAPPVLPQQVLNRHPDHLVQNLTSLQLQVSSLPNGVKDIDADDHGNPQLMAEEIGVIYNYLKEIELKQFVKPRYMAEFQRAGGYEITPKMRTVLIDWLIQVHARFHLMQETLYITVATIDRYLQESEVRKKELQLVGVTAMMIASKFEEMYAPEIGDFVYITDNAYSKQQIRSMERKILSTLKFELGRPHGLHFLRRYSKAFEVDTMKHQMSKYLLELCLIDYELCHVVPSLMAAAALYTSCRVIDGEVSWDDSITYHSGYKEDQLLPVVAQICVNIESCVNKKFQATRTKYASHRLMAVSQLDCLSGDVVGRLARSADADKLIELTYHLSLK